MTTAATSMTTMQPSDLDKLQDGELLTMFRRAPAGSAERDAVCEDLGISQMHVSRLRAAARVPALTPSRVGARVKTRVTLPDGLPR
jgi:hypothetical protein